MENKKDLLDNWLYEEKIAHIHGWDFSHISGRYREEDDLPWDFGDIIKKYLKEDDRLLDMETGGGEFILTFNHDPKLTSAIEGYEPNIKVCEDKLLPMGIDFRPADGGDKLPFDDEYFDVITNRHGAYSVDVVKRLLKDGGLFLTQQVGAENDKDLVELLMGDFEVQYPNAYLKYAGKEFIDKGFEILEEGEAFRPIEFYDVGALVWFARIIDWEFPYFSVEKFKDNLFKAQEILERDGVIKGQIHRYYFVARKG
ncbi:MAG: class I SAM-dependent methyltransferase [Tissierellia bacterium]|nr:class I SAM-dependent methyltransferase [Tissierellia bacterium]